MYSYIYALKNHFEKYKKLKSGNGSNNGNGIASGDDDDMIDEENIIELTQIDSATRSSSLASSKDKTSLIQEHDDSESFPNLFNTPSPEDTASVLSKLSFWWAQPTVDRGYKRTLELTDIPDVPSPLKVENSSIPMENLDFNSKYPIMKNIYLNYVRYAKDVIYVRLLAVTASLVTPFLLKYFILYVQNASSYPNYYGWLLCFALFVSSTVYSVGNQHAYWFGVLLAQKVKGALMMVIYRKMLRLDTTSKRIYTGKILNYISVDAEAFQEFFWNSCVDLVINPTQILFMLVILCFQLGIAGLVGFALMCAMVPVSTYIVTIVNNYFIKSLEFSDERVRLIGEFISGIRFLKYYNWEKSFVDRINVQRDFQLHATWKKLIFWAANQTVAQLTNGIVLFVTFTIYVLRGNDLNASTAFTALTIFLLTREPINKTPECFQRLFRCIDCAKRLEKFLSAKETKSYYSNSHSISDEFRIIDGDFSWYDNNDDTFTNIDLNIDEFNSKENNNKSKKEKKTKNGYSKQIDLIDSDEENIILNGTLVDGSNQNSSGSNSEDESIGINQSANGASEPGTLTNINMIAPSGKLTMIVGGVGSGKTSLVSALIGEIHRVGGEVFTPKTIGYTPQMPWLVSGSLRENITFGLQFDRDRYIKVIEACCLKPDLTQLPAKDLTEIGEKGVNLSGGQKQRISLARALYSNSSAYVMDEPLSAVDAEVAKHLFDHCILGMMRNTTRVLVTHQLQFLPSADHIIVMDNGKIIQGTYQQLKAQGIDFESIMKTREIDINNTNSNQESSSSSSSSSSTSNTNTNHHHQPQHINIESCVSFDDDIDELKVKAKLFVVEERGKGAIAKETYLPYFKAGGSLFVYIIIFILYFSSQLISQSSDYWLVIWSNHSITPDPGPRYYLLIYLIFLVTFGILLTTRHLVMMLIGWRAAKSLHTRLLNSVFYAPCSFFDQNPSGRIINRFSKDISDIDNQLIEAISDVLYCGSSVTVSFLLMIYLTPFIVIPFFLLIFVYNYIQKMYRASSRELKRMESISRSPVFSHQTESFNGLTSIRTFKQQDRFNAEMEKRLNLNIRLFYHSFAVNRWLGVRLEALTGTMVLLASVFSMLSASSNPGIAGMAVSTALGLTGFLNWTIRQFTELEVKMNSVERVMEYVGTPPEGIRFVNDVKLPEKWPSKGAIEYNDLYVKYRSTMDPSLKGLSCKIEPGSKVGIVGRTGAGKSTIGVALFRMLEAFKGSIIIDGIDISTIGLDDLRSRLSVVPQDPFLFSGSIRSNIDPFNQYTDEEIWYCLDKTTIKKVVESLPGKLDYHLDEGGDGFSVGQKQLLSLTRTLIRKSSIVLMDEATASLDYNTDHIIKQVVRECFKDRTVLTIAHRLDTVIDSDKILVIDAGRMIEYDNPIKLINDGTSKFNQLVKAQTTFLTIPTPHS